MTTILKCSPSIILIIESYAPIMQFLLGFGGGHVGHEYLVHRLLLRASPPQDIASLVAQTAQRLLRRAAGVPWPLTRSGKPLRQSDSSIT
jgi:hypothetical protein